MSRRIPVTVSIDRELYDVLAKNAAANDTTIAHQARRGLMIHYGFGMVGDPGIKDEANTRGVNIHGGAKVYPRMEITKAE